MSPNPHFFVQWDVDLELVSSTSSPWKYVYKLERVCSVYVGRLELG